MAFQQPNSPTKELVERWRDCAAPYPRVALFGAGRQSRRLLSALSDEERRRIVGVVDDNPATHGAIAGVPVLTPESLPADAFDAVVLATDTYEDLFEQRARDVWNGRPLNIIPLFPRRAPRPDQPWMSTTLSPSALAVPTMLADSERRYLKCLTSQRYTGAGRIVELGPFVGGSTAAMADGLAERGIDAPPIVSVDRFEWFGSHRLDLPDVLEEGADFRPVFWRYCEPFRRYIDLRKAHLFSYSPDKEVIGWPEAEPIEILFVDAAKGWPETKQMFRVFGEHLIPGVTTVVFQDFQWFQCYHLTAFAELLAECLELEFLLDPPAYTATFRVTAPMTGQLIESLPDSLAACGIKRTRELLARWRQRADGLPAETADNLRWKNSLHRAWLEYSSNDVVAAVETTIAAVEAAPASEMEYLRFVLSHWAGDIAARHPDHSSQADRLRQAGVAIATPIGAWP